MLALHESWSDIETSPLCHTVCASDVLAEWSRNIPAVSWSHVSMNRVVEIDSVCHGNRRWVFREPIRATVTISEAVVSCEYEPLHLFGYGGSVEEAVAAIEYDFVVSYDEIAEEDDENLTARARELKASLLALVGSQLLSPRWTTDTVPFDPENVDVRELGVM